MTDASDHRRIATLIDEGRLDEAMAILDPMLRDGPGDAEAWNSLGRVMNNLGRFSDAESAFRQALALSPDFADALSNLGHVLRRQDRTGEALEAFEAAVGADPEHAVARSNLGAAMLAAGDTRGALAHLDVAARLRPDHFQTHYNRALALHEAGRPGAAADAYRRALAIEPADPAAWSNLGAVLLARHALEEAADAFRQALAADDRCVTAMTGLAGIAELEGDDETADQWLARAQECGSGDTGLAIARARLLLKRGRADEAREVVASMLDDARPVSETAMLHYTLGDIADKSRRYRDAFHHYRQANDSRASGWNPDAHRRWVDALLSVYTPELLQRLTPATSTTRPVFIVGMPRSGTTLTEQILASHPDVCGGGELPFLGRAAASLIAEPARYPDALNAVDRAGLDRAATHYLEALAGIDAEGRHVTDKMWQNIDHVGLIQLLFGTGARVIHCRRARQDTLLSCYFQSFGTVGLAFTNRLDWLSAYHAQYRRLMDHWRAVCRLDVFEMSYEDLVADQETHTRRLIAWLGLAWHPACLDFHRTRRTVLTASHAQVREPMHSRSVGRFEHYREFAGPLLDDDKPQS